MEDFMRSCTGHREAGCYEHVLTDFLHYVKMARSHSVKTEHRAQESVKEHKRILEAIRQRDGDLAEQLANEHIQHVIENLDLH